MNHPSHFTVRDIGLSACMLLTVILTGCANEPTALERSFGESVQQAAAQQTLNPPGTQAQRGPIATDGVTAVHGIERYEQSYARPPAPVSVFNIQAGGSAPPAMPR